MTWLARRPITLILLMTNSCSYGTNGLIFIKFQISIKIIVVFSFNKKIQGQVLRLSHDGLRAQASKSHQVLEIESSS